MRSLFLIFLCIPSVLIAQCDTKVIADEDLNAKIFQLDECFFTTAYGCDVVKNRHMFTEDLEFYHDVGGLSVSLEKFMSIVDQNFCKSQRKTQLVRKLKEGTMQVFPLKNNEILYGAVQTGEHYFYEKSGADEKRVGLAKFSHVWVIEDAKWKISRVLSYDHQPAD